MIKINSLIIFFISITLNLNSTAIDPNILIYDEGTVQVTSQINAYEDLKAGEPIFGSIMITHDANQPVDVSSFKIKGNRLKVKFSQEVKMETSSSLTISIYQFRLSAQPAGTFFLPAITVTVGNQEYKSLPLPLEIN